MSLLFIGIWICGTYCNLRNSAIYKGYYITYRTIGIRGFRTYVHGIFCDTTLTVTALSNFDKNVIAAEEIVNSHMESFVNNIQKKSKRPTFNLNLLKKDKENEEEIVTDEDENDRLSLEDLLSQERLKFARTYTEKMVATMGVLPRSAVKRIKGYKRPEKERNSFETARELVKKYVANKRGKEND